MAAWSELQSSATIVMIASVIIALCKEKKVKEYIERNRQFRASGHVSQVLVPAEKVYQVRNGKKV